MKKVISYNGNMEYWRLKARLLAKGWNLKADAYWTQIFEKGNKTIVLDRI